MEWFEQHWYGISWLYSSNESVALLLHSASSGWTTHYFCCHSCKWQRIVTNSKASTPVMGPIQTIFSEFRGSSPADHSLPSSAEVKNARSCTPIPPRSLIKHTFFLWHNSPTPVRAASFLGCLRHIKWNITVSRTSLDEWSARRRDLYLTTLTRDRHPCLRRDSNPRSQQAIDRTFSP